MRRLLAAVSVVLLLLPTGTSAAGSWQHFSSRSFGFAVRYPSDWHKTVADVPGQKQLILQHTGKVPYAMTVFVLDVKQGRTPKQTLHRVMNQAQGIGSQALAGIAWSSTSLGGKPGLVGIMRPPTEGGVTVVTAVYVVGWHAHAYEVTLAAYGRPPPTRLGQFPTTYRQILASWHFLS